eukprot:m.1394947 g.1394947  ORF g.1394947 m.1394947 type:complete len:71 (-) comp24993_c0_seq15:1455-1667(-)
MHLLTAQMNGTIKKQRVAQNPEYVLQRIHLFDNGAQLNPAVQVASSETLVCRKHAMWLTLKVVLHLQLLV